MIETKGFHWRRFCGALAPLLFALLMVRSRGLPATKRETMEKSTHGRVLGFHFIFWLRGRTNFLRVRPPEAGFFGGGRFFCQKCEAPCWLRRRGKVNNSLLLLLFSSPFRKIWCDSSPLGPRAMRRCEPRTSIRR